MNIKNLLIAWVLLIASNNFVQAQNPTGQPQPLASPQALPKQEPVSSPAPSPAPTPPPQAALKITPGCECLGGAIDKTKAAYSALEEEPWPAAIKACKVSVETLKNLLKTCKCPELPFYQSINEAYLKYAEGGEHLDSADETNCPFAMKKYTDADVLLNTAIPKITNTEVSENAKTVQSYIKEEEQFLEDECKAKPQ